MKLVITCCFVVAIAAIAQFLGDQSANAAPGNERGSSNGQPFQTLRQEIDLLSGDLSAAVEFLQEQINESDNAISTLQMAVAMLDERVLANETNIADLEALTAMQGQLIAALDADLGALEQRVAQNEDDIQAIILADQLMQQMIDANKQAIATLEQMVAMNIGDVAVLDAEISTLQTSVANLQGDLAAKQDRVTGTCPPGSSIRVINSNGSVACETDNQGSGVGSLQVIQVSNTVTIPSSIILVRTAAVTATCPSSHTRTGGGFGVFGGNLGLGHVDESRPSGGNGWRAIAKSDSVGQRTLRAYVHCGRVQ